MLYAPTMARPESRRLPEIQEDSALTYMKKACPTDDAYLFAMRASAYTSILWVHSLQRHAYSLSLNRPVEFSEFDSSEKPYEVFNVILPAIEGLQSLLLAKAPEREALPTTNDEDDIRAAEYANDLMDWIYDEYDVKSIARQAAVLLATTGNVFLRSGS
jgi:hypothetical protein